MSENKYIDGFVLYGPPLRGDSRFEGRTVEVKLDVDPSSPALKQTLEFAKDTVTVDGTGPWQYQAMAVNKDIYLVTVHMLADDNDPRYCIYVLDEATQLTTRVLCHVTTIEKGSTTLSDTTNLVVREITFGYYGAEDPIVRHHYTHDLCDWILETCGTPGDVIRYYIHSDAKITYYQKEWPLGGNPIDKDGLGMGEASFLRIAEDVYVITFTKHAHGNQPFMLWDMKSGRFVGNWAGVSRRSGNKFVTTGYGWLRKIGCVG